MQEARLTEEQIIGILQEHEAGAKCAEPCRRHGMSEGTFHAWKAKSSGMTVSEAKRLKALDRAIARHRFEGNGEGERQAEEAVGRADARHGGDDGTSFKKG
jgi:putative transposase